MSPARQGGYESCAQSGLRRALIANVHYYIEQVDNATRGTAGGWRPPRPLYANGVLAKYARLVADASRGAVTDLPGPEAWVQRARGVQRVRRRSFTRALTR